MNCLIIAGALAGLIPPGAANPQDSGAARRLIEAGYRRENAALSMENVAGVMVHYSRDYVYRGRLGEQYRLPDLHRILVQMFSAMRGIRSTTTVQSVIPSGKEMRARVRERLEAQFTDPRTRKVGKLSIVEDREDHWRPVGKTWVKARSRSISQRETLDGKPVPREKQ